MQIYSSWMRKTGQKNENLKFYFINFAIIFT